jgi:hypothetical protein
METKEQITHGVWRPQRYFIIRKAISKTLVLYVSAGLLVQRFGINLKTIQNGVSKFVNGRSSLWKSYRDKDAIVIDWDLIPPNSKKKAKLPIDPQKAYEILKAEYETQEDINRDAEVAHLQSTFEDVYHNRWPAFLKFYEEKISKESERILYAKSHALIDSLLAAIKEKWPHKIIFKVYQRIIRNEIDALDEPRFSTISPVYFWRIIRNCKRQGIPSTLIHDSRGESRELKVKMTGAIKAYIRLLSRSPQRFTIAAIAGKVKTKYDVDLSPSSIKSIKKKNEDRNVLEYDSNGKVWSRQNGLPKITRFLAEAPGEQYQGDYYKLQFYCRDVQGKVVRLWAYVVLDVFSKKVVGWSLGEKPSATMAKNAFKMAFVDHCFLPEEILVDNDSLYQRPIFKRLIRRLNGLGVITTKAYPNIPTWKAEIESFFAVFQKLHSSKPWYKGEDVQSKNITGNPAKEYADKIYRDVSSMMSVSEMITEFGKMIEEYNQATNDRKKKIAPADYFRMYQSKRIIKWEKWMEPLLFWRAKTKKRIKDDGRIDLQIDGVEYCYQVTQAETLWKYKNSDVRMCYDPKDLSRIYVFERGTLRFIGEIEPRMVMTRQNKKEVIVRQRRILKEAQDYLKDKRKSDEEIVNGVVGASIRSEALADKIIKRQLKRRKFEREVGEVEIHD